MAAGCRSRCGPIVMGTDESKGWHGGRTQAMIEDAMATRILVVEDDPHVRATLRLLLEDEQYEVIEAADGEAGRRASIPG